MIYNELMIKQNMAGVSDLERYCRLEGLDRYLMTTCPGNLPERAIRKKVKKLMVKLVYGMLRSL